MPAIDPIGAVIPGASAKTDSRTMRAIVQRQYGEPDVLACEQVACPVPGPDEVLVRVHAAG
ncbi:MAG TPA: hypothetical protein VK509_10520, partial [Polyangiales bacterium]|nr:hypothetical protein [Polyangiales bacterium]